MYCEVNVLPVSVENDVIFVDVLIVSDEAVNVEKTALFAVIVDPVNVENEVGNADVVPLIVDAVNVEKTPIFAVIDDTCTAFLGTKTPPVDVVNT
jgi:hypothetical protein